MAYLTQGRDINLDIKRVVGYRQFCNKLWNAVRFALTYLTDFVPSPTDVTAIVASPHVSRRDLFVLARLNRVIDECGAGIADYALGTVANTLHSFFLYDVCDLYLELIKPVVQGAAPADGQAEVAAATPTLSPEAAGRRWCAQATLYTVLEQFLRYALIHPLLSLTPATLSSILPLISTDAD